MKNKKTKWFYSKQLSDFQGIRHGFSTKNITDFSKEITFVNSESSKKFIFLNQVHQADVLVLKKKTQSKGENYGNFDGVITDLRGQCLCIRTADCLPILIHDSKKKVIGALHGGWKPISKGIIEKAIHLLKINYQSSSEDLHVAVGSGICGEHYEVKEDLLEIFLPLIKEKKLNETLFFKQKAKGYLFDLKKLTVSLLNHLGVCDKNIDVLNRCTFGEEEWFYSYRRNKTSKRLVCFIQLNQ